MPQNESEDEDAEQEIPPMISAVLNKPRNTPILNLVDEVSADVARFPALEKARLMPIVNAAPNTPNSHLDRIYELNTTIAGNQMETQNVRSAIAIKHRAVLPFTLPGTYFSIH